MLGSKEKLPWSFRQKIALGTAKGIMYLHEGCQRRIIHRDITAANILLTEDFEPQVWICIRILLCKYDSMIHHHILRLFGIFFYGS